MGMSGVGFDRTLQALTDEELDALVERSRSRGRDLPEVFIATVIGEALRVAPFESRLTPRSSQPKIPRFKDDREAAKFWATHDSATYRRELREVAVKVSGALRRRIAVRAKTKKSRAPAR